MSKSLKNFKGIPVVFNFHIDEYKSIESQADIEEFEMLMKNSARVEDFDFSKENLLASGTTSCSGGRCDDCDSIRR